jgi:hypothetical protein
LCAKADLNDFRGKKFIAVKISNLINRYQCMRQYPPVLGVHGHKMGFEVEWDSKWNGVANEKCLQMKRVFK